MDCRKLEEIMIRGVSLKTILENHKHWLHKDVEGWEDMRANLHNVDFTFLPIQLLDANFSGAMLTNCDFSHSDLSSANFNNAALTGCCFNYAKLHGTTFKNANIDTCGFSYVYCFVSSFKNANLYKVGSRNSTFFRCDFASSTINDSDFFLSDFESSRFKNALVYGSILSKCNLKIYTDNTSFNRCNLNGSNINRLNDGSLDIINSKFDLVNISDDLENVSGSYIEYRTGKILKEPIIGYKKCSKDKYFPQDLSDYIIGFNSTIVTLEIPKDAIVFSINGNKFRTNKVKVISIDGADRAYSCRGNMSYYVGDEINISDFDCRYNVECSNGIHFFMTKEEADAYLL